MVFDGIQFHSELSAALQEKKQAFQRPNMNAIHVCGCRENGHMETIGVQVGESLSMVVTAGRLSHLLQVRHQQAHEIHM